MKQPIEPSKDDCCNSGCSPCIFDVYEKQLKLYKKFLETGQTSEDQVENAVSQLEYSAFILVEVVEICEAHIQLFFKRSKQDSGKKVRWKAGDHFLLKYSSKGTSCTRAYTPIKYKKQDIIDCDFSVIVKVYQNGLVTKHLNQLKIGDETLWRGPYGSYDVTPNKFKRIIMIAQGTGMVPFISIIESILDNEEDMTKMVLYYCTKDENSILMREELYTYKEYWNFSYKIFLGLSSDCSKCKYQEPLMYHKLGSDNINLLIPFTSNDQFLLCGSQEFMEDLKTLLRSENGALENIVLL